MMLLTVFMTTSDGIKQESRKRNRKQATEEKAHTGMHVYVSAYSDVEYKNKFAYLL